MKNITQAEWKFQELNEHGGLMQHNLCLWSAEQDIAESLHLRFRQMSQSTYFS